MSKLFEIFGKGITIDTTELIWHWLMTVRTQHQPAPPPWQQELDQVLEHMAVYKLCEADESLRLYLFEYPECIFGRITAGALCLKENEPAQAFKQLQSVYFRQPSNTMALYTMGYCKERLGQLPEALEFYQDCVKFKSHLQLPRQRMAAIYLQTGRVDKAIHEYEMLTTEHPEDISSHVLLGYLYLTNGHYDSAVDSFNMAILTHPDNFDEGASTQELQSLVENGAYEEAIEQVEKMMEQLGPQPDLYVQLADVYSRIGMSGEAITCYQNALKIQPIYLEAAIKLGSHHLKQQQFCKAAEQFNQAGEINDEIVDAYLGLCIAQYRSDKEDDAHQTLSLASAIHQNSVVLYSETAMLHLQSSVDDHERQPEISERTIIRIDDTIHAHKEYLQRFPASADVHYKYGILLHAAGRYEGAVEAYQKALEINETHYRARIKLALVLFETQGVSEALSILFESPAMDMNLLNLHYKTAMLFCDQKQFARALRHLKQSMIENENQETYNNIELVLENLGLIDRAVNNWKKLSEIAESIICSADLVPE